MTNKRKAMANKYKKISKVFGWENGLYITDHAVRRWVERIDPSLNRKSDAYIRSAITDLVSYRTRSAIATLVDTNVILSNGARLVIRNSKVVTVINEKE